jgi:hypothetical protein
MRYPLARMKSTCGEVENERQYWGSKLLRSAGCPRPEVVSQLICSSTVGGSSQLVLVRAVLAGRL